MVKIKEIIGANKFFQDKIQEDAHLVEGLKAEVCQLRAENKQISDEKRYLEKYETGRQFSQRANNESKIYLRFFFFLSHTS